ncbi:hypothetical protein L1887_56590 [Cichorium endivia]|nr:hypothetical protein L1887_56590 [Cichorium endivia]
MRMLLKPAAVAAEEVDTADIDDLFSGLTSSAAGTNDLFSDLPPVPAKRAKVQTPAASGSSTSSADLDTDAQDKGDVCARPGSGGGRRGQLFRRLRRDHRRYSCSKDGRCGRGATKDARAAGRDVLALPTTKSPPLWSLRKRRKSS